MCDGSPSAAKERRCAQHGTDYSAICPVCGPWWNERLDVALGDPEFVRALDLHKERIRRLQEALCECQHRKFFQADLHDELCPVYVIAAEMRREYEPRV